MERTAGGSPMTRPLLRALMVLRVVVTLVSRTGLFAVFSDRATTGQNDVGSGVLSHAANLQIATAPRWRGWSMATLAAAFAVLLPLTTLRGCLADGRHRQAAQSGSMQPTYAVGALLVVAPIDASQVNVGMPVVFEDPQHPGRLVVHRVVAQLPGDTLQFATQGDANATRDPAAVPARMVRGRVLWQYINGLGPAMEWLQWPRSFLMLVVLPGLLLGVAEWRARRVRPAEPPPPDAGSPQPASRASRSRPRARPASSKPCSRSQPSLKSLPT